jgi:hypothetical protein
MMTKDRAESAERTLRACGWEVRAGYSRIRDGYELVGAAADGGRPLYGFSHNDMKVLILGGAVARIQEKPDV